MRALATAFAFGLLLVAPAAALGKTTQDITYTSTGKAATPGAVAGTATPGTYEDIPFTIAADDSDGSVAVEVHWNNPADDFDLYVYKKNSTGGLDQVGSSASGPPATSEQTTIQSQGAPLPAGDYVVRIQNYASSSPDFAGVIKFAEYKTANVKPRAALKVPAKAVEGKAIKLDASGSIDPDGSIVNYAWDLDGNGSMETNGGTSPTLTQAFSAGVHHLTVRVTDDRGARSYATATVTVAKPAKKKKRKPKK